MLSDAVSMPPVIAGALTVVVLIAGAVDIQTRRIPNWLVLTGLTLGIGLNTFLFGWPGAKLSLTGAALAFGVYLVFYLLRAMGAGDVKLMAAAGALVGPHVWLLVFFWTAVMGGFIAVLLLLMNSRFKRTFFNIGLMLHQLLHFQAPFRATEELDVRSERALRLPHGATIALGTMVYLAIGAVNPAVSRPF